MATVNYTATPGRPRRRGDAIILKALAVLNSRLREPGACLTSSGAVRALLMLRLAELEHEVFGVLFLNAQNRLIEYR